MDGKTSAAAATAGNSILSSISRTLTLLVGLSVVVPVALVGGLSYYIARYSFERTAMGQIEDALEGAIATVDYYAGKVDAGEMSRESTLVEIRRLFCGTPQSVTLAAASKGEALSFLGGFAIADAGSSYALTFGGGTATIGPSTGLDAFMRAFSGLPLMEQYALVNGPMQVRIRYDLSRAIQRMRESGYVFCIVGSDPDGDPGNPGPVFELFHPTLTMVDVGSITNARGERVGLAISQRKGRPLIGDLDGYLRYEYDWANPGEPRERRKITLMKYYPKWNWVIAAGLYEDEYFAPLKGLASIIAVGLAMFCALFVALARKTGRVLIGERAEALGRAFSRVADDEGNVAFPTDWNDEFGDMARAADEMSRSLAERNRRLAGFKAFLSAVLDAVPGPIFALDRNDGVTMANAATLACFPQGEPGSGPSDGVPWSGGLPPALRIYLPDVHRVRSGGVGCSYAREAIDAPQRRIFSVSILGVPHSADDSVVLVLFDLTELDRAEEGLRLAQKIEMAGTIAAGVAHDMNNVLGGILGCSSLLRVDAERGQTIPPEELLHSIGIIDGAVRQASESIRRVLDFGRAGARPFETVEIRAIIDEALVLARKSSPGDVVFMWDRPDSPATIQGDDVRLEQVFLNLLLNARDAVTGMRPAGQASGGRVSISLTECALNEIGDAWMVLFVDDGVGMDDETMSRAFDPFFSRKSDSGGTGLGLAMVRHILNQHGGRVSIESVPGKGTTVRVVLPIA